MLKLSPRQTQVLEGIASGQEIKQIANRLGLSVRTVDKHRSHLMNNLNLHKATLLTLYAVRAGLVDPARVLR